MKSGHQTKSKTDTNFLVEEAIQEGAEEVKKQQDLKIATYRLTEKEVQNMAKISEALRLNSEDVPRRAIHYLSFVNHEMQKHLNPDRQASVTESHERDSHDWENWKTRQRQEYLRELNALGNIPQDDPIRQKRYNRNLELDGEIWDKLNQLKMTDEIGESIYLGVALLYHQLVEKATQLPAGHT
ncbi:MAG: hypothetical protein HLUCCO16_21435 [Phormidium sp. OSCR]|nr:MAG: hypothetical protein HLUCCO16_21435 [Phormidium sp. OSCR]